MILVSHDLGVIAEMCDRVAVMYAGEIVELADTATLLGEPRHPYTISLLRSLPDVERAEPLPAVDRRRPAGARRRARRVPVRAALPARARPVPRVGDRAPVRRRRRPHGPVLAPRRDTKGGCMAGAELRIGVIGCGRWANWAHLPGWTRDERCRVVAVCDADPDLAQAAADKFGVGEAVSDHRARDRARRHRRHRRRHRRRGALRRSRWPRSRRASTCSARSRWRTTTATRCGRATWRRRKGLEHEGRLHVPLQPGRPLHEGADRRGLRRDAVHLQRLRAELAVDRPADAAPAGRRPTPRPTGSSSPRSRATARR